MMRSSANKIRLGTAPDSWGVWRPDDPRQVPWNRFLDEVVEAGYQWIELGPRGYLPTEPERLRDEVGRRGLRVSGGTAFGGLHRPEAFDEVLARCRDMARTLTAVDSRYLVFLPENYRDIDEAGTWLQPPTLGREQWALLVRGLDRLGRVLNEEFGITLVVHPHADSHVETQEQVERLLDDTDPMAVSLCLDTGHVAFREGDNLELISKYPKRIRYVHLKQVDPTVVERAQEEGLSFAQAVRLGAACEPPAGVPGMEALLPALADLEVDLHAVVEQDLYPCEPHVPLPIATRTRQYFNDCGIGTTEPAEGSSSKSGRGA